MKILFNPFEKIAGFQALILGWFIILLSGIIAYFSNCHFNGVIDAHFGAKTLWWVYLAESFVAWASISIVYYFTGVLFSQSKIRFADVAGTLALARYPMLFVALLAFGPMPDPKALDQINLVILLNIFATLIFSIWMIALFFNAYKISCNMKGAKAVWTFIIGLIIAEIISKIVLYQLNLHFDIYH